MTTEEQNPYEHWFPSDAPPPPPVLRFVTASQALGPSLWTDKEIAIRVPWAYLLGGPEDGGKYRPIGTEPRIAFSTYGSWPMHVYEYRHELAMLADDRLVRVFRYVVE